ncbi:MAG: hypothetical protein ACRYFA_13530 [Janthinobacterium lividum]
MKSFKPHFLKLLSFLLLVSVLSACEQPEQPGAYKNEAIKASKREEFHKLNDQLLNLLKDNKVDDAENLMSKELLEDNTVKRTMELITNRTKQGSYRVLDEYYLVAKTDEPGSLVINTDATGADAYTLKYNQSSTKENYVAFLVVPKDAANKWLITAIYGKYNYGWKLNKFDIAQYAINGKNAPELYKLAKAKYAKGFWVDAANDMTLAVRCFHPSGQWQYNHENEMNQFYYKTLQQASAKTNFPITISQVPTKPKIFRILTQDIPEGTFPMLYYVSSINIKDTVALKKENAAIKKVIGKVIPGVDQDKKYVLYAAFNSIPNKKNNAPEYDFKS